MTAPTANTRRRSQWLRLVSTLIDQIDSWAKAEGWTATRSLKTITDRSLGAYRAPVLRVHLPGGDLQVEPVGLQAGGNDGRVDLEAYPTLNRVKLVGHGGHWDVVTDSNVPIQAPWQAETFVRLANDLLA